MGSLNMLYRHTPVKSLLKKLVLQKYIVRYEQDRGIDDFILHPSYNCQIYEYDIAVVRVNEPVQLVENQISSIQLPCMKKKPKQRRRKRQGGRQTWNLYILS